MLRRLLCHERTLALVAVSACTAYGDDMAASCQNLVDARQHILQCIGRMGIIYDCTESLRTPYGLKPPVHGAQCRHQAQHLLRIHAQRRGSTIDTEQIAHVETSDESHADLRAIDFEEHSLYAFFDDVAAQVSHRACGIRDMPGATVLQHDVAIAVVDVRHGKRLW